MTQPFPVTFFAYFPDRHASDPYRGFVLMNATMATENVAVLTYPLTNVGAYICQKNTNTGIKSWFGSYQMRSMADPANVVDMDIYLSKEYTIKQGTTTIPVIYVTRHLKALLLPRLRRNVIITPAAIAPVVGPPVVTARPPPLSVHVARQLLELATLKHEMCPITVEEFSAGNVAVMPCGHLFMQMAIEESFKKEPNKCPACRQVGRPTFV